jgi:hypothetical protein
MPFSLSVLRFIRLITTQPTGLHSPLRPKHFHATALYSLWTHSGFLLGLALHIFVCLTDVLAVGADSVDPTSSGKMNRRYSSSSAQPLGHRTLSSPPRCPSVRPSHTRRCTLAAARHIRPTPARRMAASTRSRAEDAWTRAEEEGAALETWNGQIPPPRPPAAGGFAAWQGERCGVAVRGDKRLYSGVFGTCSAQGVAWIVGSFCAAR